MAHKTPKIPVIIAPNLTSGDSEMVSPNQKVHQGLVFFIKAIIPNYTNNVTATITILDKDGDEIYSIDNLLRGKTHVISDIQIPLVEQEIIRVVLSGVPGGNSAWTHYVTLYYLSDYI